jgi:cytochrome c-type biogenesis protein CcmE
MKKIILLIVSLCFAQLVLAETNSKLSLHISLTAQDTKTNYILETKPNMTENIYQWLINTDKKVTGKNKDSILLLAKVERNADDTVKIKFLVTDMKDNSKVTYQPILITRVNQEAKMIIAGKNGKFQLDVLVS